MFTDRTVATALNGGLLDLGAGATITDWAQEFLSSLALIHPDEEMYLFALSRRPKERSYLIGSTTGIISNGKPARLFLNERSAQVLLSSQKEDGGIRMISSELPYEVTYQAASLNADEDTRRFDITFYDGYCFDHGDHSIVLALILNDVEIHRLFSSEDKKVITRNVQNQALPLFEILQLRESAERHREEAELLLGLMGEANPTLASYTQSNIGAAIPQRSDVSPAADPVFLNYVVRELRQPLQGLENSLKQNILAMQAGRITATSTNVLEECNAVVLELLTQLRNLSNIAFLGLPESRLTLQTIPVKVLLGRLLDVLRPICEDAGVRLVLDEQTRNIHSNVDIENLLRAFERLGRHASLFAKGGTLYLRSEDNDPLVPAGYFTIGLEDSAPWPNDSNPAMLLSRPHLTVVKHPRLSGGGGILYQAMSAFAEKSGARFRLIKGPRGGLCAQFVLPLSSRVNTADRQTQVPLT